MSKNHQKSTQKFLQTELRFVFVENFLAKATWTWLKNAPTKFQSSAIFIAEDFPK